MDETNAYVKYADPWEPRLCPMCGLRLASAYGQLFREPPPRSGEIDNRKPINEVWIHDEGPDCVRLAYS